MRPEDYLVLHYDELSGRATDFYERMGSSEAFRALFLNDPVGTAASVLFPDRTPPPAGQVNAANRMLFALLGNDGFRAWAAEFQQRMVASAMEAAGAAGSEDEPLKLMAATFDRAAAYRELVSAVLEHCDAEIVSAFLGAGGREGLARPVPEDPPVLVVALPITYTYVYVFPLVYIGGGAETLSRVDLERISHVLSEELAARAREQRESGGLAAAP